MRVFVFEMEVKFCAWYISIQKAKKIMKSNFCNWIFCINELYLILNSIIKTKTNIPNHV